MFFLTLLSKQGLFSVPAGCCGPCTKAGPFGPVLLWFLIGRPWALVYCGARGLHCTQYWVGLKQTNKRQWGFRQVGLGVQNWQICLWQCWDIYNSQLDKGLTVTFLNKNFNTVHCWFCWCYKDGLISSFVLPHITVYVCAQKNLTFHISFSTCCLILIINLFNFLKKLLA